MTRARCILFYNPIFDRVVIWKEMSGQRTNVFITESYQFPENDWMIFKDSRSWEGERDKIIRDGLEIIDEWVEAAS